MESKDLSDLENLVIRALDTQGKHYDAKIEFVEKLLAQNEQQIAMLTQAYTELAAIVETLASMVINRSDDEKKEFFEALGLARKQMIDTLQHGLKLAEQNTDRFTAYAPTVNEQPQSDKAEDNK